MAEGRLTQTQTPTQFGDGGRPIRFNRESRLGSHFRHVLQTRDAMLNLVYATVSRFEKQAAGLAAYRMGLAQHVKKEYARDVSLASFRCVLSLRFLADQTVPIGKEQYG